MNSIAWLNAMQALASIAFAAVAAALAGRANAET